VDELEDRAAEFRRRLAEIKQRAVSVVLLSDSLFPSVFLVDDRWLTSPGQAAASAGDKRGRDDKAPATQAKSARTGAKADSGSESSDGEQGFSLYDWRAKRI
jgi:hypothetical protein